MINNEGFSIMLPIQSSSVCSESNKITGLVAAPLEDYKTIQNLPQSR